MLAMLICIGYDVFVRDKPSAVAPKPSLTVTVSGVSPDKVKKT